MQQIAGPTQELEVRKELFGPDKTGEVIRVRQPVDDWAFVPEMLPARWTFDAELWPLLVEAKECLGTLNGIGRTLPNPQLLLRPLQSREALRSSSLEGTYATPEDLLLYEKMQKEPRSQHDPVNSWKEVYNYSQSLIVGRNLLEKRPISTVMIKEMHSTLLSGVRGRDKIPGQFKRNQNHIGSNRRYVPPPPTYVADLMDNLQTYINVPNDDLDPLVRAFIVHYQFEAIHPFADGNGRVGRALLSLMVYLQHCHHMPWLYMSAYFENYKDEYVAHMFRVSTSGLWKEWIEFCLRGVVAQTKDSIRRCEELKTIQADYHNRAQNGKPTTRTHDIIDGLFQHPLTAITDISRKYGVAYNTAKSDITLLVGLGMLREVPELKPKVFVCDDIYRVAYSEDVDY